MNSERGGSSAPEKERLMRFKLIGYFIILIAVAVFVYPTVGSMYQEYRAAKAIDVHTEELAVQEEDEFAEERERCMEYNRSLAIGSSPISEKSQTKEATYESLLNAGGVMGYIEIPVISQKLPIYHYSDDAELERGIGHIHGSSLPVGGESTNCVLTGHRGLPGNMLFTRLDEVGTGDMIYLTVLGERLAYRVTGTEVILPEDTEGIRIERGRDLITLITCTPYAVNTHRLVITAERTEEAKEEYEPIEGASSVIHAVPLTRLYIAAGFIAMILVFEIAGGVIRRRKHEA